jgi:hypothetical protein
MAGLIRDLETEFRIEITNDDETGMACTIRAVTQLVARKTSPVSRYS